MGKTISYKDAGVDLGAWNSVKGEVGKQVASTYNSRVLGSFGQFGGMFDIAQFEGMSHPVLVSSTDSVGTKVMIAFETKKHDTVGRDIVNHCVNDILVMGAKPLFFLDYIGIYKLYPNVALDIVSGLAAACRENGCVLIGGETAEMPDLYKKDEYDLVGTIVGVVDRERVIDGSSVRAGDCIIGLRSSGLHTNGYSLARKVVTDIGGKKYSDTFGESGRSFGEVLQEPHRSYLPVHELMQQDLIKACAHITGGGFQDNVNRVLPENCDAIIDVSSWAPDPIFQWMQTTGNVAADEMYHTFNMGIGMVLVVDGGDCEKVMQAQQLTPFSPVVIGSVADGEGKVVLS